ncbi:extracellular membrane [Penicillium brevicompactum]|uniref:uncharacterized protein n=1 Tax=Penicillium brevicompactum TaxID=5074 RepID=UPI002541ECB1|nr:uncharacterized protein N7506_002181 [Penicillium brevicompactum]KAJ5348928.1 hypothetical protein N7506_002181 [Penicillium brevicompactum]
MKFAAVVLAFAALAHAQSRADVPPCALPCLDDAVKQKTSCATDDYACICKDQDAVKSAATSCVVSKCGISTSENEVLPAVKKICASQ